MPDCQIIVGDRTDENMTLDFRQLDSLGDSRKKWRRYFWAKHFIELREWDAARYFVGLLCGQNDWTMPGDWRELSDRVYPKMEGG